jgi:hypothetical protein
VVVNNASRKVIKIGAKVVRHARYVPFRMAEVAVPRKLLVAVVERIAARTSFLVEPKAWLSGRPQKRRDHPTPARRRLSYGERRLKQDIL